MAGSIRDNDNEELSEINVTPFIDVMLVLLIIFMVAAPLSTVDVPVDLPVSVAKPEKRPDTPVFVTIKPDLTLAVGEAATTRDELVMALDTVTERRHDTRLFIRADKMVPYGELMGVLNKLQVAGYLKVALVGLEGRGQEGAPAPAVPAASPSP